MPRKRRIPENGVSIGSATPTQQDEGDILSEVGAESNESGELLASEDRIRELGAVDADSARENRRVEALVNKKRANQPNVSFNTGDVLSTYDAILRCWTPNTIDIRVKRLTGSEITRIITARPRTATELYEALLAVHGQHEESDYEVVFVDSSQKVWRGKGKITLPDTRPPSQQGQSPMYYPPPPGYPLQGTPPGYPPQQQPGYSAPQPSAPSAPQPVVLQAPAVPDMSAMMASMRQMFDMFQMMQQQAQPPVYAPPPPQQQAFLPPPPPGSDMNANMAWMQQAFEIFRSMAPPGAQQPPPQQQPQMMPPAQPPPGTMWVPGFGFIPLDRLMQAVSGTPAPPPYREPPPYRRDPGYPPPSPPQQPPQRSAADQFRDSVSFIRTAAEAIQNINDILPQQHSEHAGPQPGPEDDDSPVKIIDTGPARIVVNKKDGTFRGIETLWANMPEVLKWAGEQREQIQKHAQQRQQVQLPPGFVEVGPGYQPPQGYGVVPVDPRQLPPDLPPPPQYMPPPIQPQQQSQSTWGAPTIPEEPP